MALPSLRFSKSLTLATALGALALSSAPAMANSAAVDYFRGRADRSEVPSVLSQSDREYYREVRGAVDRKDWKRVQDLLGQRSDGPLQQHAKAEYFLASGSPKIELPELEAWLASGTDHPNAERIATLASKRGATALPALPAEQRFQRLASIPKRIRPAGSSDGTMPAAIADGILGRIKNDDPLGAQQLLDGVDAGLSPAARAEWRQRIAWSFYIENDDADAYRLAQLPTQGGPWVAEGWWTAGLAAWRLDDCTGAMPMPFPRPARSEPIPNWPPPGITGKLARWCAAASRKRPAPRCAAARNDETLLWHARRRTAWHEIARTACRGRFHQGRLAEAARRQQCAHRGGLAEIGEDGLADEVLRHQARIGDRPRTTSRSRLARDLGLPSTQLWMAYNAPRAASPNRPPAFPTPKWTPTGGWQVDPALVYAHALQESVFRASVVSPAGARGLMQIMPAAARDHAAAGRCGMPRDLNKPEVNLAFGQRHLRMLRIRPARRACCPRSWPPTMPVSPRSRAGTAKSATRAIRCCGSNRPLLGNARLCEHRHAQLLDVRTPGRRPFGKPDGAGPGHVADLPGPDRIAGRCAWRQRSTAAWPLIPRGIQADQHRGADRVRHARAGGRHFGRHPGRAHQGRRATSWSSAPWRRTMPAIASRLNNWIDDQRLSIAIITTGGTGLTGRDVTPEALERSGIGAGKDIPGFGELFRWISYRTIGTSTSSRAPARLWRAAPTSSRCPAPTAR
jgi:soluble lytic murein transglycosylase